MIRSSVILTIKNFFKSGNSINCLLCTQVGVKRAHAAIDRAQSNVDIDEKWSTAIPFKEIPGPSKISMLIDFLPGGRCRNLSFSASMILYREEYGDFYKLPGLFGKPDIFVSYNPDDFQKIYRTEGTWPIRRELDTIKYYRKEMRPDIYRNGGLAIEQGKSWADFRTIVNPVMMQPKTVKLYVSTIDNVAVDFIARMKTIRDSVTMEVSENFEDELNRWALESIGVIALDTRLGLIGNIDKNSRGQRLIEAAKSFFSLLIELEFKPSLWKIFKTQNFNKLMLALDEMTDISLEYILEAKKRLDANTDNVKNNHEESVLEKLLKIDPKIATVMASDMIIAGSDTTSSGFVSILYNLAKNPDKQNKLREELISILPETHSPLCPEKMSRMPYLRACIKEALRLLPVIDGHMRNAGKDIVLEGYQIPKGATILMQSIALQREEKYYQDALKFIPERWLKEMEEHECSARSTNPFIFLPFGFGPRMCIGRRFAELEMEVLVSRVIRNFYVEWNHPDIRYKSTTINVPDCRLMFKISDVEK